MGGGELNLGVRGKMGYLGQTGEVQAVPELMPTLPQPSDWQDGEGCKRVVGARPVH